MTAKGCPRWMPNGELHPVAEGGVRSDEEEVSMGTN
jgi:hypothetical protein